MAIRSILLAGALAILCCQRGNSLSCTSHSCNPTLGFVTGLGTTTSPTCRKRPRGSHRGVGWTAAASARPASAVTVQTANVGSFFDRSGGRSVWVGGNAGEGARRCTWGAGGGARMGIVFDPPPWDELVHGFGQAIVLGIMGGMIPKWTKERIREKEAGLEVDELYEMGLDGDGGDEDEYGYGAGYVCGTCDNTNEVDCRKCGGKGFFVSESALPKKCDYCAGLGTLQCPECEERREMLRHERERRKRTLRLPPSRDEDFPFGR